MPTAGPNLAGAGASVDRAGNTAWTTPGNITADDAATASAAVPTDYLVASTFGFSIPAGATILGVTVEVQAHETGTGSSNYVVQLHSDTTPTLIGSSKNSATVTGTTPTTQSFGGAADVWGASLTSTIVNGTGFGVSLWSTDTTNTLLVDFIRITIEYAEFNGEDGDTHTDGIAQRNVASPLARAAAILATTVAIAAGFHSPVDEIATPQSGTGGGAPQPVAQRAQQGSVLWQWGGADDIVPQPAVAAFEADTWEPPVPPVRSAAQQPWFAQDDLVQATAELAAETPEAWSAPLVALAARWTQVQSADDDIVPQPASDVSGTGGGTPQPAAQRARHGISVISLGGVDEFVQAAPSSIVEDEPWLYAPVDGVGYHPIPVWASADDAIPTLPVDEQYQWIGQVRPAQPFVQQWADDQVIVQAATPLPFDEETWAAPWVVRTPAWTDTWSLDEEKIVAPAGIVEDEAWQVAVVDGGGSRWIPLWSAQEAVPILPVDEQYPWQAQWQPRAPVVYVPRCDDEAVTAAVPLPVDELYPWQAQWQPRAPFVYVPRCDDEAVTAAVPLPVDELYPWQAQWQPRAPFVYVPWSDDEAVTAAVPLPIDEQYWWTGAPRRAALAAPAALADDGSIVVTASAGIVEDDYHWSAWSTARRPVVVADWHDDGFAAPSIVADEDSAPHLAQWAVRRPAIVVEWIDGDAPLVLGVDEEPWSAPFVAPYRAYWLPGWLTDPADVRYTLFGGSPAQDRTYHVAGGDRALQVIDGERRLQVEPGERDEELDT
jgi:hypothetical protein